MLSRSATSSFHHHAKPVVPSRVSYGTAAGALASEANLPDADAAHGARFLCRRKQSKSNVVSRDACGRAGRRIRHSSFNGFSRRLAQQPTSADEPARKWQIGGQPSFRSSSRCLKKGSRALFGACCSREPRRFTGSGRIAAIVTASAIPTPFGTGTVQALDFLTAPSPAHASDNARSRELWSDL